MCGGDCRVTGPLAAHTGRMTLRGVVVASCDGTDTWRRRSRMVTETPSQVPGSGRDEPVNGPVLLSGLDGLFTALEADGRTIVGPTVRDHAIVLAEIGSASQLPFGWRTEVEAGTYRLRRGDDRLA